MDEIKHLIKSLVTASSPSESSFLKILHAIFFCPKGVQFLSDSLFYVSSVIVKGTPRDFLCIIEQPTHTFVLTSQRRHLEQVTVLTCLEQLWLGEASLCE